MSQLARPFTVHSVDVEGMARKVLQDELKQNTGYLTPAKEEEVLAFLIETIWALSTRYDPARGSLSFSSFAYRIGRRRVTDWYRHEYGDKRYGKAHQAQSLELLDDDGDGDDDHGFDEALVGINPALLSGPGRRTLYRIARVKVEHDLTHDELAALYCITRGEVARRLSGLRTELEDIGVLHPVAA